MEKKINSWLNNPVYFRYGYFFLLGMNAGLYYFNLEQYHLEVFYILAIVFLGIGFYQRSSWFIITFSTLMVSFRVFLGWKQLDLIAILIIEFTYLFIAFISVGLMKRNKKIKNDSKELIFALSKTIDMKDSLTAGHSRNAAWYATEIAKKMNLSKDEIIAVNQGALLHDIGKIGIPENILMKPNTLNAREYEIIKKHPLIGYEIIKHISDFSENGVLDLVLYHHERYDGSGYPNGLKGNEIPLFARIMAIADTFDAIVSDRVYRNGMEIETALAEIKKNKGTQFDPEITDVFLSLFEREKDLQHKDFSSIDKHVEKFVPDYVGRKLS